MKKIPRFDFSVGNPPYQNDKNRPIFQKFQRLSQNLSHVSVLIYMASRWWYGTTILEDFRRELMSNSNLEKVIYYTERETNRIVFPGTGIAGGISIVHVSDYSESRESFTLEEGLSGKVTEIYGSAEEILPIRASDILLARKVLKRARKLSMGTVADREEILLNAVKIYSEKLNALDPIPIDETSALETGRIKLYGNLSGSRNGRASLFSIENGVRNFPRKWKVCFGQSIVENENRALRLFILDPETTWGRAAISLAWFDTREEAEDFLKYASTRFFEKMFRLTIGGRVKTLAVAIPDIGGYGQNKKWTNLSVEELDRWLFKKFRLSESEIEAVLEDWKA